MAVRRTVLPDLRRRPTLAALVAVAVLAAVAAGAAAAATVPADGTGTAPAHDASIDVEYEGENLTLPPVADATVRATTSLDPGTELVFRLDSKGEPSFSANATAVVAEDGSVEWTLDLSRGELGQGFQIDVFVGDETWPTLGVGGVFAERSASASSGQPGFDVALTVLGVALAGLAALVAVRRR